VTDPQPFDIVVDIGNRGSHMGFFLSWNNGLPRALSMGTSGFSVWLLVVSIFGLVGPWEPGRGLLPPLQAPSAVLAASSGRGTACPREALAVLRTYLTRDTSGARLSSEAWKASGIDTLTWGPNHEEPAYDGATVVTGFDVGCVAVTPDSSVVVEITWDVVGFLYSGDPIRYDRKTMRDTVVLKDAGQGAWRLWGGGFESRQRLWFGPHISPRVALARSPWLDEKDREKLRALIKREPAP
jgi:hypothetical protein